MSFNSLTNFINTKKELTSKAFIEALGGCFEITSEKVFVYEEVYYIEVTNDGFSLTIDRINFKSKCIFELEKRLHQFFLKEYNKFEENCLFLNYDKQPEDLKIICNKYLEKLDYQGLNYKECREFLEEVNKLGYTFDYELDAEPFHLRKIKQ